MTTNALHPAPAEVTIDDRDVYGRVPSPALEWVEVDGQVVAWTEPNQSLHLFDAITSMVFQLMDGATALSVTVTELAEAFGQEPDTIRADVHTCVGRLVLIGAVESLS